MLGDSELPLCLSLWGSFRPSLEPIPACPVSRISPDHSHQLILLISPLAKPHLPSAPPHILSFPLSFPFYMFSAPSPITLSFLSTQSLVPYLYPHHSPLHLPFSTQLSLSKTIPNALSLTTVSPSPHIFTAPLRLSGASPFSSSTPVLLHPLLLSALASCGSLRPPLPLDTPLPLISPSPDVPLGGIPLFLSIPFPAPGGRASSVSPAFPLPSPLSFPQLRSPPSPPPSSLLNSCPSPVPVTSEPPPSPTSPPPLGRSVSP